MQNNLACVWATRKELWDSFLNDPALARAIENARSQSDTAKTPAQAVEPEGPGSKASESSANGQSIGARLRAYETPITDDILRQSIR